MNMWVSVCTCASAFVHGTVRYVLGCILCMSTSYILYTHNHTLMRRVKCFVYGKTLPAKLTRAEMICAANSVECVGQRVTGRPI